MHPGKGQLAARQFRRFLFLRILVISAGAFVISALALTGVTFQGQRRILETTRISAFEAGAMDTENFIKDLMLSLNDLVFSTELFSLMDDADLFRERDKVGLVQKSLGRFSRRFDGEAAAGIYYYNTQVLITEDWVQSLEALVFDSPGLARALEGLPVRRNLWLPEEDYLEGGASRSRRVLTLLAPAPIARATPAACLVVRVNSQGVRSRLSGGLLRNAGIAIRQGGLYLFADDVFRSLADPVAAGFQLPQGTLSRYSGILDWQFHLLPHRLDGSRGAGAGLAIAAILVSALGMGLIATGAFILARSFASLVDGLAEPFGLDIISLKDIEEVRHRAHAMSLEQKELKKILADHRKDLELMTLRDFFDGRRDETALHLPFDPEGPCRLLLLVPQAEDGEDFQALVGSLALELHATLFDPPGTFPVLVVPGGHGAGNPETVLRLLESTGMGNLACAFLGELHTGSQSLRESIGILRRQSRYCHVFGPSPLHVGEHGVPEGTGGAFPFKEEQKFLAALQEGNKEKSLIQLADCLQLVAGRGWDDEVLAAQLRGLIHDILRICTIFNETALLGRFSALACIPGLGPVALSSWRQQLVVLIGDLTDALRRPEEKKSSITLALNHIHQNFNRDLPIDELARLAHLTPQYFSTLFKQETGFTPVDYITKLRMDKTVTLLRETDMPIQDICHEVGYSSAQYFIRVFKRYFNTSPMNFRISLRDRL
jgi:AraC-like DNA-binding protein